MRRKKTDNFSPEIMELMAEATSGQCHYQDCHHPIADYHHMKPNRTENRLRFPLFIQSIFNCKPLCRRHHTFYAHEFNISDRLAEAYETWLRSK